MYVYIYLFMIKASFGMLCGSMVASWLVRSSLDRAAWVLSPGWRHHVVFLGKTLNFYSASICISTQEYKWVPTDCWGNLTNCGEVTRNVLSSHSGGGVELLHAYRNRDKLQQLWVSQLLGITFLWNADCEILKINSCTCRYCLGLLWWQPRPGNIFFQILPCFSFFCSTLFSTLVCNDLLTF